MDINEEIKIWERNAKDEFGRLLKRIEKATDKYFSSTEDEYGIIISPLSHYINLYALDGPSSRKYIGMAFNNILTDYDIIPEDKKVNSLMIKLKKLYGE